MRTDGLVERPYKNAETYVFLLYRADSQGGDTVNCGWCGANADGSQSHGICDDCAALLELQSAQRQFDKVPSYVEQNAAAFARECNEILENAEVCA